jgi:quinol monooxygenase YgiN
MADPLPSDFSDEFREIVEHTRQLCFFWEFAGQHMAPKPDSVLGILAELKLYQRTAKGLQFDQDVPLSEGACADIQRESAQAFERRVLAACQSNNHTFLRKLCDASRLIAEGRDVIALDIKEAAVYAFGVLRSELGHRPNRDQIKTRVEQWRNKGGLTDKISGRHWDRIFQKLEPLFKRG